MGVAGEAAEVSDPQHHLRAHCLWTATPPSVHPRGGGRHGPTPTANGRHVILTWPVRLLYSPGLSDWFSGGHMTQPRMSFNATVLLNPPRTKIPPLPIDLKLEDCRPGVSRGC